MLFALDVGKAAQLISQANPLIVIACLFLLAFNLALKVIRWHFFLEAYKIRLNAMSTASTYLASLFLANLTPARVGEVLRPLFLKKRGLASASRILPSVIVERVLDMAVLLVFAVIFIFLFSRMFPTYIYVSLLIVGALIALLFTILSSRKLCEKALNFVLRLPIIKKTKLWKSVGRMLADFYKGLAELRGSRIFTIIALSFVLWASEFTITYLSALALGVQLPFLLVAGIFSVAVLLGIASSLPGGLGPTEAIFAGFFVLAGVPAAQALSITLLARLLTFGATLVFSAPFVLIETRTGTRAGTPKKVMK